MTITLPFDAGTFWILVFLGSLVGLSYLVFRVLDQRARKGDLPDGWQMKAIAGFAAVLAPLWLVLMGVVLFAFWGLVWSFPDTRAANTGEAMRWHVLALVGLLTALGGLVGTPLALIRLSLTQKQADTAAEALFNDKINAASDDLHAMRQRWDEEAKQNVWEPDIVRRNAAIDRLEGLATQRRDEAPRIARMLSVYVREMSNEKPPVDIPKNLSRKEITERLRGQSGKRTDIETAVQALGRFRPIKPTASDAFLERLGFAERNRWLENSEFSSDNDIPIIFINLQRTNLQGFNLSHLNLNGAYLAGAYLQGSTFTGSELIGVNLLNARLQGAEFNQTDLRGNFLAFLKLDKSTKFQGAFIKGVGFQSVDLSEVELKEDQIVQIFGDATVTLPGGIKAGDKGWPKHFADKRLSPEQFVTAWRAWQREIGFDPDDPSTW